VTSLSIHICPSAWLRPRSGKNFRRTRTFNIPKSEDLLKYVRSYVPGDYEDAEMATYINGVIDKIFKSIPTYECASCSGRFRHELLSFCARCLENFCSNCWAKEHKLEPHDSRPYEKPITQYSFSEIKRLPVSYLRMLVSFFEIQTRDADSLTKNS
jgi:hypothetical protein